ncbi:recombination mediator RecR [Wolbachia endosymbiont of Howardula sp.]|uniref:recombination mediator RecR n=1 Tax=Wolbachia endosymbiont of Howardula sp. TaxID=2916816 RepID=UPI00217CFF9D|nr:recombination mediator RecR [Wolbachia endosymbiont of Howardula sp.]UWI83407.1 recombination mediator RecR [Wolbachia endosymbiont of Howardula sp.]
MHIKKLIYAFSKLPGLGPASSRRLAIHLLQNKEQVMIPLAFLTKNLAEIIVKCELCNNLDIQSPCSICNNPKRDSKLLCIVEGLGDLWALETANIYFGLYHVLSGRLSAINGITPKALHLDILLRRISQSKIEEIILAINSTLEGQITLHYIVSSLRNTKVKISRLACGIPMGGEIDYLDEGTLKSAMMSRQEI